MGSVFLAEDLNTKKLTAVKIINADVSSNNTIVQRFKQEIKISRQFTHPFVIKILDGDLSEENSVLYLAMEFLDGEALNVAFQNKTASTHEAHTILLHITEALSYIHDRNIYHRDIKPDNILIVSAKRTVLLDFGLALAEELTRLSMTSDRPGTWMTMSPEQINGETIDCRSDIYSLGITMYWATTGITPYSSDEIIAIATGNTPPAPKAPHELNSSIEKYLSDIILKCMVVNKNDRFQSTRDLLSALHKKKVITEEENTPQKGNCNAMDESKSKTIPTSKSKTSNSLRKKVSYSLILVFTAIFTTLFIYSQKSSLWQSECVSSEKSPNKNEGQGNRRKDERIITKLRDKLLKSTIISSSNEIATLGVMIKKHRLSNSYTANKRATNNDNIPYKDMTDNVAGLYDLFAFSYQNKRWNKAYNIGVILVKENGYRHGTIDCALFVHLLSLACQNADKYSQFLVLTRSCLKKSTTTIEKKDSKYALIHALQRSLDNNNPDKSIRKREKIILAEALSLCRDLVTSDLTDSDIPNYIPLYKSILREIDNEKYRKEGISFFKNCLLRNNLNPHNKYIIYTTMASLLSNHRSDGWEKIPKADRLIAHSYRNKALIFAQKSKKTTNRDIYFAKIQIAESLNELGDIKTATNIINELLIDQPEVKNDADAIKLIASLWANNFMFEKAGKVLKRLLRNHEVMKNMSKKFNDEIKSKINEYEQMQLLSKFKGKK